MLEAGEVGPFTPADFIRLFGVEQMPSTNGHHSQETLAAAGMLEAAEGAYRRANDDFGRLTLEESDDPASTAALSLAEEARASAAEMLSVARVRYHELAKRDDLRRAREEYEAGQAAMAEERAGREQTRTGVLVRLRGRGRS